MLQLPTLYQNGMVLQGGRPVRICGSAASGQTVTLTIQGQNKKAIVYNYHWEIWLDSLRYSPAETLEICCGQEKITLTDLAVGEVWLAGGQSNMEFPLCFDQNWQQESTRSQQWDIRFYDVPEAACPESLERLDYSRYGCWRKNTDADNLQYFSAVGYYFAQKIASETGHVVGIIGCNWGGTPACTWADPELLRNTPAEVWLDDYRQAMIGHTEEEIRAAFLDNPMQSDRSDLIGRPMDIRLLSGISLEEQKQLLSQMPAIPADPDLQSQMQPNYVHTPGRLFESMVRQVAPYSLRGVIWYQGESDSLHPEVYDCAMAAVIRSWRRLWKEELPFYQVQLPSFGYWMMCDGQNFPIIRSMQQKVADTLPDVYMAATMDCGMLWDIHPKNKQPAGLRLAYLALVHTYGMPETDAGSPGVGQAVLEDGRAVLQMTFAENGLRISRQGWPVEKMFALYVENCCLPDFTVQVRNHEILICHPEIQKGRKIEIRFAENGYCPVCIENSLGFTVRPFTVTCI